MDFRRAGENAPGFGVGAGVSAAVPVGAAVRGAADIVTTTGAAVESGVAASARASVSPPPVYVESHGAAAVDSRGSAAVGADARARVGADGTVRAR
ncbi:MAG TPA: hypothetical protein VLK85_02490 [Ramlibacter sp.]|nr:hypothetical protein [Ramlibacter sp.]